MGIFGYLALPCSFRSIDCGENAQCESTFNDYSCLCVDGARKTDDKNPKSACLTDYCYNIDCGRGECQASFNSHSCSCDVGAIKKNETNPESVCITDHCLGVDCKSGTCQNSLNDYICRCQSGLRFIDSCDYTCIICSYIIISNKALYRIRETKHVKI